MATVTSLGFNIFSTYSGRGVNAARRDLRRLERATDRINTLNRTINDTNMNAFKAAVIAGIPAMITLGKQALVAAGALTAMGVAAGAAGATYGAVMIASSKRAFQLREANRKLNDSQREHVKSVHRMRKAWNRFLDSKTGSRTLVPLNIVIKALTRNMGKLKPLVNAVHPVIRKIARAFADWMDRTDGFQRFVNVVKRHGVPALDDLLAAGRHVLGFLGIGFRALLPHVKDLSKAIRRGAKNLEDWAKGGGFRRFLKDTKKDGPGVKKFFNEAGPAAGRMGQALEGVGPPALKLATAFAKLVNNTPVPVLQAMIVTLFGLKAALSVLGIAKVLKDLGILMPLLRGLSGLLGIVGSAAGAAAIGLGLAAGALVAFHFFLTGGTHAWSQFKKGFEGLDDFFGNVANVFHDVWGGLRRFFRNVLNRMRGAYRDAIGFLTNFGKKRLENISDIWHDVWGGIRRFFRSTWKRMSGLVRDVFGSIRSFIKKRLNNIKDVWHDVWGAIRRFFRSTWRRMSGLVHDVFNGIKNFIKNRLNNIKDIWHDVWGFIRRFLRSTWRRMSGLVHDVFNGIKNFIKNRLNNIKDIWHDVWGGIRRFFRNTMDRVKGAAETVLDKIKGAFKAAVNFIKKQWDRLKGITAGPVKFFADKVYNNGLRKGWNATFSKLPGIPNLPSINLPFARGGLVRGPGGPTQDKIPARLSSGEFVMRASSVKKIGVDTLHALNEGRQVAARGAHPSMGDSIQKALSNAIPHLALGGLPGMVSMPSFDWDDITKGIVGKVAKIAKGSSFLFGGLSTGLGAAGDLVDKVTPGKKDPVSSGLKGASRGLNWGSDLMQDVAKEAVKAMFGDFINVQKKAAEGVFSSGGKFSGVPHKKLDSVVDKIADFVFSKANMGLMGNGFRPWKKWGPGDGRRVGFRGVTVNVRTRAMIRNAEKIIKKRFSVFQGSWSHARASAGTHAGGGAVDLGPTGNARVGALRASGFAAWNRGPGYGSPVFSKHIHAIAAGDPTASAPAKAQVAQFFRGGDGLGGPDNFISPAGMAGVGGGSGVARWAGLAAVALKLGGIRATKSNIREFLDLMRQESGGNPRAINRTDSNARRGDPSRGLMQVIGSTFRANHVRGTSNNIFDPLANMAAAARYIRRRYGGRIPNAPYAMGGLVDAGMAPPVFDGGGFLGPGLNLVNNATGHPEPVGNQMRDNVELHIHGNVYTKNDREFRDMVVSALADARRKGRA